MQHTTRPSTTERASFMRVHIRKQLVVGGECPTPAEVVSAIGGTVELAIQVLGELPGYERPTRPRREPSMRRRILNESRDGARGRGSSPSRTSPVIRRTTIPT